MISTEAMEDLRQTSVPLPRTRAMHERKLLRSAAVLTGTALALLSGCAATRLGASAAPSPASTAPSEDVGRETPGGPEAVVRELTRAIDHFDLDAFVASFADEITMFYPIPSIAGRVDGLEALAATQKRVFESLAARFAAEGRPGPPYFGLEPADLEVQPLGETAAVVTWHVDRGEQLGRRTAVLERTRAGWKIVSYHASNLPKPGG